MNIGALMNRPHQAFYPAFRGLFLFLIMSFTVIWLITGFDSSIYSVLQPNQYGNGTHISTMLNMVGIVYVILVNIGDNGLTLQGFKTEVKRDLCLIWLTYLKRDKALKKIHLLSYSKTSMNPFYLLITSLGVGIFSAYVFEIIWAYLFNLGNFGSLVWPLYYMSNGYSFLAWRNFSCVAVGLVLALVWPRIFLGVKIRLRNPFNKDVGFLLIFATILLFTVWFYYPFEHHIYTYDEAITSSLASSDEAAKFQGGVMPSQTYFPQTIYAIYQPVDYPAAHALGFYAPNDLIHLFNVVTKVFCTFACAYPFIYAKAYSEIVD